MWFRAVGLYATLAFLNTAPAHADTDLTWNYQASFGTSLIDKGEEIARGHAVHSLGIDLVTTSGTIEAGVAALLPLGEEQAAFDQETEFWIGHSKETALGTFGVTTAWINVPGVDKSGEFEVAGMYSANAPLAPTATMIYNQTTEALLGQIAFGPERTLANWTLGLQAQAGYLDMTAQPDRTYWGLSGFASLDLGSGVNAGCSLQFVQSSEDSFVAEFRDRTPFEYDQTGFSFQLHVAIAR